MSLLAISLTIKQKLADPLAKFLLLLLADRHNGDTGECYPSVRRLCEDSGISRSTVFRKLDWLEAEGFIVRTERRRTDGTKTSTDYDLPYVNMVSERDHASARDAANLDPPERASRALPPEDWWPEPATISKLQGRYPHHETGPDTIRYLVTEWVNYCHAAGHRYVKFDAAWTNSAERYLRKQTTGPATFRSGPGKRGGGGALSGAIRRLGGH